MQSVNYSNYNRYADALARKRKKTIIKKVVLSAAIGVILAGAVGYVLFFAPYFQIESFSFYGLKTVDQKEIEPVLDSVIKDNVFQIFKSLQIQQQKNILFFNSDVLGKKILALFPVIKSLEIKKDGFHKIIFNFLEREPRGVWCFNQICRYFDEEGVLWGQAARSSGVLLLNINDLRPEQGQISQLEPDFLNSILKVFDGLNRLGIKISGIEISPDSIGDYKVYTASGYFVILNKDSNINGQINILRIFLAEKSENFKPAHLDLRIEGRVYYK